MHAPLQHVHAPLQHMHTLLQHVVLRLKERDVASGINLDSNSHLL